MYSRCIENLARNNKPLDTPSFFSFFSFFPLSQFQNALSCTKNCTLFSQKTERSSLQFHSECHAVNTCISFSLNKVKKKTYKNGGS